MQSGDTHTGNHVHVVIVTKFIYICKFSFVVTVQSNPDTQNKPTILTQTVRFDWQVNKLSIRVFSVSDSELHTSGYHSNPPANTLWSDLTHQHYE